MGTLIAVFLSLYLVYDEKRPRFSIVSFTQDKTKDVGTSTGMKTVSQRVLIFYGVNYSKYPLDVLYQGLRIKQRLFLNKNTPIKVPEETEYSTKLKGNDFEKLEISGRTVTRTVDFDDIQACLLKQIPANKKSITIEFVYMNTKGKKYTDSLKFENPLYNNRLNTLE